MRVRTKGKSGREGGLEAVKDGNDGRGIKGGGGRQVIDDAVESEGGNRKKERGGEMDGESRERKGREKFVSDGNA